MSITRRDLSKLAAAAALAGGAGSAAAFFQGDSPEDWAARLERDLNARVSAPDTRFGVVGVTVEEGARPVVSAVVELHWPPGLRRRLVRATGADAEAAYEELLAGARDRFKAVAAG